MSLLTYNQLLGLVEEGVITNTPPERVNAASIDVTLGEDIFFESPNSAKIVDLAAKQAPPMSHNKMDNIGDLLRPGEFILASTEQVFNLPEDIAIEFKLKSSLARAGLDHALAGWGGPGWAGSVLTLELRNSLQHSILRLKPGMPIGQVVFWRGNRVPQAASYRTRGQYNNDTTTTPTKGVR